MGLDNFLYDGQSQAGTVLVSARPGWVRLEEPIEYVRQSFRRNTDTGIHHIHLDNSVGRSIPL